MLAAKDLEIRIGSRTLLSSVNLSLRLGEMVGLIGPNGSGKTTLLRALANLRGVDAGTIQIDGRNVADIEGRDLAQNVSYLAQGGEVHWPMKVEAVVALGRLPHRRPFRESVKSDSEAIERAMAFADIASLRNRTMIQVSGGERMRVLLARALAVEAPLLLADEPISALDPLHQLRAMTLLKTTAREGKGVLVVLHDLSLAARFCDRLVLIAHEGIVAQGTPSEVLTEANLARAYGTGCVIGQKDGISFFLPREQSARRKET